MSSGLPVGDALCYSPTGPMRRPGPSFAATALVMVVACCSAVSEAQPSLPSPSEDAPPGGREVALTISGGVSLGAYEAGYLYLTTQSMRHSRGRYNLRLVAGASAGSVNSVLAAMSFCRADNDDPTKDLGWSLWTGLGFDQLYDKKQVGPTNVFTRDALEGAVEKVRAVWNEGLPIDCDVVLGISATRLQSYPVELNDSLSLPRQEEKFTVRIQGRGPGVPATFSNYVRVDSGVPEALLPLHGDGRQEDFNAVRDLLFASSAFPVAFKPQQLDYCLTDPLDASTWTCDAPTEREPFIDGGVFDNNPLRLAADVVEYGLVLGEGGRGVWSDIAKSELPDLRPVYEDTLFAYLDTDTTAYPQPSVMTEEDQSSTLSFVLSILGEFVSTARSKELYTLAEEKPELLRQLLVTHRNFPTISGLLGAFLGFFEQRFREFDYYLGMYDSYAEAGHRLEHIRDEATLFALLDALHPAFATGDPSNLPESWKPFACMLGWYESSAARFRAACDGEDMRDFRILVQVSLDRLYSLCQHANQSSTYTSQEHFHCRQAAAGRRPPEVVEGASETAFARREGESEFDFVMRLLTEYQFHFVDLGLDRDEAKYATTQIRRRLLSMATKLSNAQPTRFERAALLTAGRIAVNSVAYEPPQHWGYFTLGTGIELGGSVLPISLHRSYMRLNLAFQVGSLRTLTDPSPAAITFSLVGGPELEMLWWTTQVIQPMLGVRAGYQFGTADRFTARPCTVGNSRDDARNCSQPVFQTYVALALIERIRTQFTFVWYPKDQEVGDQRFDLLAGFGFQFF
ncbi:MAG: patatin-like phospholipase family protein [Myxococcota bacterium]